MYNTVNFVLSVQKTRMFSFFYFMGLTPRLQVLPTESSNVHCLLNSTLTLLQSKPQSKGRGKPQAENASQKPQPGARESPKQNLKDRPKSTTEDDEKRKRKFTLNRECNL